MQDHSIGDDGVPGVPGEVSGRPEIGTLSLLQEGRHVPPQEDEGAGRLLPHAGRQVLQRGLGRHQQVCVHGVAGRLHNARVDQRRAHDDRLLQRRHQTRDLQDREDRHPRDRRGEGVAGEAGLLEHRRGRLHGTTVESVRGRAKHRGTSVISRLHSRPPCR